jgi:GNAT superfamily N-acetyltransferase
METRDGYEFRAPTADDLAAVADVLIADQRESSDDPVLDADFVRQVWSRPDFDLAADAWVVTDDAGAIVAYGQVRREEPDLVGSWGVVDPTHRGRGIGSAVFDRIEGRAAALLAGVPNPRFHHAVTAGDRGAEAIVRARGLRPIRHFWHMQIDLAGAISPRPSPAGIEIAEVRGADDLRNVHAILERGFAEDPGDHPRPFERWAEEEARSPTYDPTLWLLASDGAAPVGALTASAGDGGGWVDWLAVLDSHRGRGVGAALLGRSFASFADRGVRRVRVNVDAENVTGATGVYERAGMYIADRWDLWERGPISEAPSPQERPAGRAAQTATDA